jgi:hypothetical protein
VHREPLHTGVDDAGIECVLPLGSPLLAQLAAGLHAAFVNERPVGARDMPHSGPMLRGATPTVIRVLSRTYARRVPLGCRVVRISSDSIIVLSLWCASGERGAGVFREPMQRSSGALGQTCTHLPINPFLDLREVIERVSTHPARLVLELTPREWKRLGQDSGAQDAA